MISKIKAILNLNSKDPSRQQPVACFPCCLDHLSCYHYLLHMTVTNAFDRYFSIIHLLFYPCLSQANCYQRFNLHQHVYLQLEMNWFDPIQLLSKKLVDIFSLIQQQRFMVIQKFAVRTISMEVTTLYSTYWKCCDEFLFNWSSHSLRIDSNMAHLI